MTRWIYDFQFQPEPQPLPSSASFLLSQQAPEQWFHTSTALSFLCQSGQERTEVGNYFFQRNSSYILPSCASGKAEIEAKRVPSKEAHLFHTLCELLGYSFCLLFKLLVCFTVFSLSAYEHHYITIVPPQAVFLSMVSVTCSQPQFENIKWKILEINNS